MSRLVEFIFFAIVFYMIVRRIAAPFRRGFEERDRERKEEQRRRADATKKIDRSGMKDAEFKDL